MNGFSWEGVNVDENLYKVKETDDLVELVLNSTLDGNALVNGTYYGVYIVGWNDNPDIAKGKYSELDIFILRTDDAYDPLESSLIIF